MIFMIIIIKETSFSSHCDFKHLLKMKEYGLIADVLIRIFWIIRYSLWIDLCVFQQKDEHMAKNEW